MRMGRFIILYQIRDIVKTIWTIIHVSHAAFRTLLGLNRIVVAQTNEIKYDAIIINLDFQTYPFLKKSMSP
jgi:hypothetical protein